MDGLLSLDARLYLALATSGNAVASVLGLLLAAFATGGLGWWAIALLGVRVRGSGRRAAAIAFTTAVGGSAAWLIAESLKMVVRRPRPFVTLHLDVLVQPVSFSFPSGDTALSFGAATALAVTWPAARLPVLLVAAAVGVSRVVVGAHYPSDVLAGALVGVACGLAAQRLWAIVIWRRWRVFVVAHTHWDRERLQVGPWYVQANLLVVSGESIVRNLQEGLRVAGSLGRAARVAYVADPFGHPAQLPQVLRGFGYEDYVFARGMGDDGEALGSVFWWQAPSGDRVRATHLTAQPANAAALAGPADEPPATLRARVRSLAPDLIGGAARYADASPLLFTAGDAMAGDDHTEAYPRLGEAVAALRATGLDARLSDLEEYAGALGDPHGTHAGEMVAGRYRPILRGVSSTRTWIKQESARCERLLLERCEPLDALTGGRSRGELRELWRALLQNQPHDSICGCSIDAAHDIDMAERFARVRAGGETLAARLAREIAGPGDVPVVWSFLPERRVAVVEVDGTPRAVSCAPLGVRALAPVVAGAVGSPADGVIENGRLRVEVDPDGSFTVTELATGARSGRLNELVDEGDRGDLYTFSYAGPTVAARGAAGRRVTAVRGDRATVTVELELALPVGLRADRLARSPERVACPVRVEISLDAPGACVDVTVTFDNRARDHRLRALCQTGVRSPVHRASGAFGWVERPNRQPSGRGWAEPPTGDHTTLGLVEVAGRSSGLALGLDGLREYGVLGDGAQVAITLVRAVGWLSRGDLRERPRHAGPALETPSAQCQGVRSYRYVVAPFGGPEGSELAAAELRRALSPVVVARGDGAERSFLELPAGAIALSSLRAARDGALAVRLVNASGEPATAGLGFARPVVAARSVDLREGETDLGNTGLDVLRTAEPPDLAGGRATIRLAPYEIGTYLVTLG
ncbi:MAG: phosphatase PAP2 family protein [Candidatus Limnocylindria bacterium]|nr:phosphatase PAP2 family protein [Candidatus Limnocylindria bacterium]